MALTKIQTNIIDRMSDVALLQLRLMEDYVNIVQMYQTEGVANVTVEDIATLPELAHVTPQELTLAKGAMDALVTAMGGYVVNSPATKLSKIVKNLP
jgi:hypothetical protein